MEFSGFYIRFLEQAWKRMNQIYSEYKNWTKGLEKAFIRELEKRLEPVAIRCLITEIHYCKQNGFLRGETAEEEYIYFNETYFQDALNRTEFFKVYPLVEEILQRVIEDYCQNISEIMCRVQKDRQQINKTIFADKNAFESVISFEQLGDLHQGGKCVFSLTLDNNEKLIYKPHGIKYTEIFQDYLERFYSGQGLKNKRILVVDKKEYGWMEYITPEPCHSEEEIKTYYQRLGITLCVCHLMNNRDMHFENIIAHGSYPVLVDLEVFECERKDVQKDTASKEVQYRLRNSVLNIGILPFYIENKSGKGVNLSGIEADRQKVPYYLPFVVNPKTSDIKIEYHRPYVQSAQNAPVLNNAPVLAGDYTEEIIKGFSGAYTQALKERESLISGLTLMKAVECRYLLRNTQEYKMLMNLSYWPELLTDQEKRYQHIWNAYAKEVTDTTGKHIRQYEIQSILMGDIPYFRFKPDGCSLYLGETETVERFFEKPLLKQLEEKISLLSAADMDFQIRIIRQTMALAKTSELKNEYILPSIFEQKYMQYEEEVLRKAVVQLGKRICKEAIYGKCGDVSWVVPRLHMANEAEWQLEHANAYMYSGIAGICVFFHALCQISEEEQYQKIRDALDRTMKRYTDDVYENREHVQSKWTGALNGEGSIVYAYQLIYQLTKKEQYFIFAKKHLEILDELVDTCKCPDLISGNAGAILIYLNMFKITGDDTYLSKAIKTADKLAESAVPQKSGGIAWDIEGVSLSLTGFSHGNAGIIYAYTKLYEECGLSKYKELIEKAIKYENLMYSDNIANWADLRKESSKESEKDSVSWCHGAAGILISRLEVLKCNCASLTEIAEDDIKRAIDKMIHTKLRKGLCLCHGNFGNIEILYRYLAYKSNSELEGKLKSYLSETAQGICCDQIIYLPQEENPGLMNGFSGMGYALLRRLYNLPDILTVEV